MQKSFFLLTKLFFKTKKYLFALLRFCKKLLFLETFVSWNLWHSLAPTLRKAKMLTYSHSRRCKNSAILAPLEPSLLQILEFFSRKKCFLFPIILMKETASTEVLPRKRQSYLKALDQNTGIPWTCSAKNSVLNKQKKRVFVFAKTYNFLEINYLEIYFLERIDSQMCKTTTKIETWRQDFLFQPMISRKSPEIFTIYSLLKKMFFCWQNQNFF